VENNKELQQQLHTKKNGQIYSTLSILLSLLFCSVYFSAQSTFLLSLLFCSVYCSAQSTVLLSLPIPVHWKHNTTQHSTNHNTTSWLLLASTQHGWLHQQ
jgi:hypothetical protein